MSCSEEETYNPIFLNDYELFLNTSPKDGVLQIDASYPFLSQSSSSLELFYIANSDMPNSMNIFINDSLHVASKSFSETMPNTLYGSLLKISFYDRTNSFNFRVPKEINLLAPILFDYSHENIIGIGTLIEWNADLENPHTICIEISDKIHTNRLYVEDNGKYRLPATAFEHIAKNTEIDINIKRYNYFMHKKGGKNLMIHSYVWGYFSGIYK